MTNEKHDDEALANHILRSEKAWELLQEYGVTEDTLLTLDFFFYSKSQSNLRELRAFLEKKIDYSYDEIDGPDEESGQWCLTCHTQPTDADRESLSV